MALSIECVSATHDTSEMHSHKNRYINALTSTPQQIPHKTLQNTELYILLAVFPHFLPSIYYSMDVRQALTYSMWQIYLRAEPEPE